MSFETKDTGVKRETKHRRSSLNNVIAEDTYTESSKSRRSTIPNDNPYMPLAQPSGKSTQGYKDGVRESKTHRINQ
jgi:hypothetical protein